MSVSHNPTEQLFKAVVRHFRDAILIIKTPDKHEEDPEIVFANEQITALTGFTPAELVGQSPRLLNGPDTDPVKLEQIHKAIVNRETYSTELKNYHRNGKSYWAEITLTPICTDDGICTHYLSVNRDITEERRVRNTLLMQSSVLDQVENAIVVLDKDRKVIYWNASAEQLYQYNAEEMVGTRTIGKLTWPADRHITQKAIRQILAKGQWQGEIRLRRKDGSHFPALVSNRILLNEDKEIIGYIGVSTDITYQKQIQSELEDSLHEKEVLLKEIHHRVKNNMQVISSLLFLQSMQSDDPLVQEILVESQNRVRSMSMVHEKLYRSTNLSRIAFDDYILELTSDQMNTWVGKNSVIEKHFDLDYVEIDIDKAIPCGLLINELISNALKHGLKNHTTGNIWLSLKKQDDVVRITVANDGNPLPDGFTLEHTETLGMQLIDSLTRQLDGSLTFRQRPHTIFELEFSQ